MPRNNPKPAPPPTVSGRWLLTAVAIVISAAAFCAWAVLCLLFWQGSWQLLYHPTSAITRTPSAAKLAFGPVGFATTDTGAPQLQGWWIAAPNARYTVLYLHGADGNLSDTIDDLVTLHATNVNVFAFDYRGYGLSNFIRPSEAHWREDAGSAIQYLTQTRHIPANSLVLIGRSLGANLALEVAAAHPEIAGLVMDDPLSAPEDAIFADPRAKLVPAHLLVRDRWNALPFATELRIPSLWIERKSPTGQSEQNQQQAYRQVTARKVQLWLSNSIDDRRTYYDALTRWLDDLNKTI